MSLEAKIDELIVALNKNTAAHGGKPAPTTAATSTKAATFTFEQVKQAVVGVKDMHGKPAAQKIIKDVGKAAELASIKPAQFAAVMAACAAMAEATTDEAAEVEEDTL
jgi:hypothetical protein